MTADTILLLQYCCCSPLSMQHSRSCGYSRRVPKEHAAVQVCSSEIDIELMAHDHRGLLLPRPATEYALAGFVVAYVVDTGSHVA